MVIIAAVIFFVTFATIRAERRVRWTIIFILPLPGLYFLIRWAAYRNAWLEFGVGAGIAALGIAVWWIVIGRRLPAPNSSIRVWEEDDSF